MTATQTKLRRGTAAQIASMTPVEGEAVVNTTDERIHVGDGTTAGGYGCPNLRDIQQQKAIAATVGGTGNAITLTCSPAVTSYTAPLKITFKPTSDSSGAVTINVDGNGTKDAKYALDNALTAFSATTILKSGLYYEAVYDGTQFQVLGIGQTTPTIPASGLVYIDTKTASGSASLVFDNTDFNSSLYDEYVFMFEDILAASASATLFRALLSVDNGSGSVSPNGANKKVDTTTQTITTAALSGYMKLANFTTGGAPNSCFANGKLEIFSSSAGQYHSASARLQIKNNYTYGSDATDAIFNAGSNIPINHITFTMDTGNIASGTIKMYGVSKS